MESIGKTPIAKSSIRALLSLAEKVATLSAVNLMCNSAPSATVAICRSGFKIVTSLSPWISLAVTSAGPLTSNSRFF